METKAKLENDLKVAMKAGDETRKRVLRMALSAIKFAEIEKIAKLDESAVLAVIHKEIKSQHESIADAERANRPDLIEKAKTEIGILEEYLPKSLTPQKLEKLAKEAIAEAGASSVREMGLVMKLLVPRLQGRATGDQASQAVRKLLTPPA